MYGRGRVEGLPGVEYEVCQGSSVRFARGGV